MLFERPEEPSKDLLQHLAALGGCPVDPCSGMVFNHSELKLTKIRMKISGKGYDGVKNTSLTFLRMTVDNTVCKMS